MGDINVNGISHELRTYEVVADFRDIGSERKVEADISSFPKQVATEVSNTGLTGEGHGHVELGHDRAKHMGHSASTRKRKTEDPWSTHKYRPRPEAHGREHVGPRTDA
jgi:hypothetical protein